MYVCIPYIGEVSGRVDRSMALPIPIQSLHPYVLSENNYNSNPSSNIVLLKPTTTNACDQIFSRVGLDYY